MAASSLPLSFIDGETLRERLGRALTIKEAIEIAIQVAAGLVAAHRLNIIHRDIKPENIMIRNDDGLAKVLDFGLAKMTLTPTLSRVFYPDTAAQYKTVLELDSKQTAAHSGLCKAYILKGMHNEGIAECQRAVDPPSELGPNHDSRTLATNRSLVS